MHTKAAQYGIRNGFYTASLIFHSNVDEVSVLLV